MTSHYIIPVVLFLLTIIFGYAVSRKGKPYNSLLFNIHKLVALAGVVLAGYQIYRAGPDAEPGSAAILLLVAGVVCVAALFASGALMSLDKLSYTVILTTHRAASILLAAAVLVTVLILTGMLA
jgi:hypothetical protein